MQSCAVLNDGVNGDGNPYLSSAHVGMPNTINVLSSNTNAFGYITATSAATQSMYNVFVQGLPTGGYYTVGTAVVNSAGANFGAAVFTTTTNIMVADTGSSTASIAPYVNNYPCSQGDCTTPTTYTYPPQGWTYPNTNTYTGQYFLNNKNIYSVTFFI